MCQDTGISVTLEIGNQIIFDGDIYDAVNQGSRSYADGFLRKSVVNHPIERKTHKG